MLDIDLQYIRGILFVRLGGKLTRKTSYKINNNLVPILLKHRVRYLVYNLYKLNEIDEAGVDAILNSKCAIRNNNGKICMCEVSDKLNKITKRLRIKKVNNERDVFELIKI